MSQAQGELPVVGQENQALTVAVESAHGGQVLPLAGQEVGQGAPAKGIFAGAEVTCGLVQGDVKFALEFDRLAVHLDLVVTGQDFCAECPDDLSVYCDPASENDFFAGAPGGHAGFGEIFLKAKRQGQPSGLVLRRPVTRSAGFHWLRFLSSSTRSNRLRTLRFAPEVLAAQNATF